MRYEDYVHLLEEVIGYPEPPEPGEDGLEYQGRRYTSRRTEPDSDVIGVKYNHVTVIDFLGMWSGHLYVEGVCDCGNVKAFKLAALKSGNTKTCGFCKILRPVDSRRYNSDGKRTPTYTSWRAMKERCDNEKSSHYENYGGRGIFYDPRWVDFNNFYNDMGERPEKHTLDRIDVHQPYCKENCRWLGYTDQRYNSRRRKTNTSGRTGVTYNKKLDKWQVFIQKEGNKENLGLFVDYEAAVKAREEAELRIYGEVKKYEDV